jgi:hypothetical protein
MGDVVDLHGQSAPTKDDSEFVTDLARFAESIVSEADIKRKYRLADSAWEALGENDELIRAIEAERLRRVRDGSSKRERARQLVVKAPAILDSIMSDASASPRHRVDAIKVLDDFAANGPQSAPAADRFVIQINLGSDVLKFDKSIEVNPHDIDPNDIDTAPRGLLPIIAAKKKDDDQW